MASENASHTVSLITLTSYPEQYLAVCSCGWQSDAARNAGQLETQVRQHTPVSDVFGTRELRESYERGMDDIRLGRFVVLGNIEALLKDLEAE
jgi:hypothetical protein